MTGWLSIAGGRRWLVLGVLTSLLGWGAGTVATAPPSGGETALHLGALGFAGNDAIVNYDFHSTTYSSTNVDWTATMMFYDNAEIDKVKGIIEAFGGFTNTGNVEYARLQDDGSYVWDSDRGEKDPTSQPCGSRQDIHMRLYADGDDRMYNTQDGYYIFGTTHWDLNEGCASESFGYSDSAATFFKWVMDAEGKVSQQDCCYWYNPEPMRAEGNHIWLNDGYATLTQIP